MLRVLKEGTTDVVVTVTELTTISSVEYLWEFYEEQEETYLYAIIANTSTATQRYDKFQIIDTTTVTFPRTGYYTYNIYEQASGSGNLDPTGLTRVETGRLEVYESATADNEYENTADTNKVYDEQ